jgi:hypothetical protein
MILAMALISSKDMEDMEASTSSADMEDMEASTSSIAGRSPALWSSRMWSISS